MTSFITIAVKPHVAQFLSNFHNHKELADKLHIANSKKYLTTDPSQMLSGCPSDYEKVQIALPGDLHKCFTHQDHVISIAKLMSRVFQDTLKNYVSQRINFRVTKEDAIDEFRKMYGITESMYSTGNIRRQLLRGNVVGIHVSTPSVERVISRKLLPSECRQVYRLVTKGFSLRTIAKHYHVHHETVRKITQKVYQEVSYKSTLNRQQSAA